MQSGSSYHIFSLPPALLQNIIPRNLISQSVPVAPEPVLATQAVTSGTSRVCNVCPGAGFSTVEEQRTHFRSDWHHYNVKVRLGGGKPVAEQNFGQLVEGLHDSLSGSASSSDESDDEAENSESDAVNALFRKTRIFERPESPSASNTLPQTPITWFHSPPSTQIGVYKAIFPRDTEPSSYVSELKDMQTGVEGGRTWAMFMTAGGHFAGSIVRVSKPVEEDEDESVAGHKKKPKKPKPEVEILAHKTFHRYTTRRKQGGAQSANDNAKGAAKSAGAQLRRYGEQALRDDIRNLLQEWATELESCDLIWLRASVSNRKIFLDYDGAVLSKGDTRLRTFPFPTRRPTQSELSRCILELTRVKESHLTEDELRAQDEAFLESLPKPKPPLLTPAPVPEKMKEPRLVITKEEEAHRERWSRLLEMISKGRVEALKTFWEREGRNLGGIDVPVPEWTGERGGTLLQVAVNKDQEDVIGWLLEDVRADPTIDVPSHGDTADGEEVHVSDGSDAPPSRSNTSRRTAYDLARSRRVRNLFRRTAASHPDWWDWLGAGHVPSALTKEQEEEQDGKKKARWKGLKDRVKEREVKEREKPPPNPSITRVEKDGGDAKSQRLGGTQLGAEATIGLTPEMRVRIERERRARAAEARFKKTLG